MAHKKNKTRIFETSFGVVKYALFSSKKEFDIFARSKGIKNHMFLSLRRSAEVLTLRGNDGIYALVQIDRPYMKTLKPVEAVGILVHEVVHVYQSMIDEIQEHKPSSEFEAYSIQQIAQNLISEY